MAFTASSLARLKDQINIIDVVSRALPLKRAGANYKGICPFHNEKTPSFVVSEQKQIFTCFGCGASGDAIEFVKRFYNLDFNDAVRKLADEYGVDMETRGGHSEDLDIYYKINREAAAFFYKAFTEKANRGYAYMKKRGIKPATMKKFGLGYADAEWDSLYRHLSDLGYDKKFIVELGLVSETRGKCYDRFRDRVMFPIINTSGKVIGFGGRAIGAEDNPKYLNSPESRIFKKKNNLYGLNLARQQVSRNGFIILVEGYMDTIGLYQGGIQNVCASLGTALTESQARLIKRYTGEVVLSYDADAAGRNAALRGIEVLRKAGLKTRVLHVTDGKDPDEFIKKDGRQAFLDLIEGALPDGEYRIESVKAKYDLSREEGRIDCLREIAALLRGFSPVEQDIYCRQTARDLGVSENALRLEISAAGAGSPAPAARPQAAAEDAEITRTERDLIKLATRDPALMPEINSHLDLLTTESGMRIMSALDEEIRRDSDPDLNRVIDSLDEKEQGILQDIIDNIPDEGEPRRMLGRVLARSRMDGLKAEEQRILDIMSLRGPGYVSDKGQDELMLRLKDIQKKMQEELKRRSK